MPHLPTLQQRSLLTSSLNNGHSSLFLQLEGHPSKTNIVVSHYWGVVALKAVFTSKSLLIVALMKCSWEEHTETFKLMLGILRNKHHAQQNFKNLPSWKQSYYQTGKFRRIKYRNQPTIIKLGDGGIVGYRVPAFLVSRRQEKRSLRERKA